MQHLIDTTDLTLERLGQIIDLAMDIIADRPKYRTTCKDKTLATLFYEPSTRTRLSFEAAMIELGGDVIGFSDATTSSATKGESLSDTIKVINSFADIIAMRHPNDGAPLVASLVSDIPIMNGGDGSHCHPTQTLTDILTIKREIGRLENLTIGLCGDLKFGRTVHSLTTAMMRYPGTRFVFISPPQLDMPSNMKRQLDAAGIPYREVEDMESLMGELDVLYMTRVQKERFYNPAEYERLKDVYVLTPEKLSAAKAKMAVLHPLPRVNEISKSVDTDPRAAYFRQVENGKFMRMALIAKLFEWKDIYLPNPQMEGVEVNPEGLVCPNTRCISSMEELDQLIRPVNPEEGRYRCAYCDTTVRRP
jgi:aspartate carbamoyltransferase catalytic subunit